MTLDRSKIVDYVTVPELPTDLGGDPSKKQLRQTLDELSSFAARYKKAIPILKPYADQLRTTIARLEDGDVRLESKWISAADYAAMLQRKHEARVAAQMAEEEAQRMAMEAEANRTASETKRRLEMQQAEAERQRQLQQEQEREEAYAAEQRGKGLEEYGGRWLPQSEVQTLKGRDEELQKAGAMVDMKSFINIEYEVLMVSSEGLLICPLDGDTKPKGINLDVVFLRGINTRTVAKGDRFRDDVFWCGTRSFDTDDGRETIHAYTISREDAVAEVRDILFPKGSKIDQPRQGAEMVGTPRRTDPSRPLEGASGCGSGFFVGNEGHFVTNEHVVENASEVEIYYNHELLSAKVMYVSKASDLALLKVEAAVEGLSIAEEEMELGADVIAVGYPRANIQGIQPKVTKGIISGKQGLMDDDTRYQTDAAIQPGNSGGPLCDNAGRVVGVIVSILSDRSRSGVAPQNVNYAIKSTELAAFLRSRSVRFSRDAGAQGPSGNTVKTVVAASALVVAR